MQTVFDWLSVLMFGALALLFLKRSMEGESVMAMWNYLPPALLCAAADYAGNHEFSALALLLFAMFLAYMVFVLKPIDWNR